MTCLDGSADMKGHFHDQLSPINDNYNSLTAKNAFKIGRTDEKKGKQKSKIKKQGSKISRQASKASQDRHSSMLMQKCRVRVAYTYNASKQA